ncbi:MutS-related protein [Clostridium manihotivorum]|uniref:DNA mismatch repair protein MutS n=1 Tax=Clostridium manihotivorum TaxID=2320868 RepID=A0A410DYI5_9CLOT|nr:DNA mismatch repair protein MutS [Clostridium manihotivorum]QAA34129.1 DNA mismatch repair protein MutS [Clostridium manihotivorum]
MFGNKRNLEYIRYIWPKGAERKREFKNIRYFHDSIKKEEEFYIDDQTWNDLDMDKIYSNIDRTLTSPGEDVFYHMLRKPANDIEELKNRDKIIDFFRQNKEAREEIQLQLYKLGRKRNNYTVHMLKEGLVEDNSKRWMYNLLGLVFPILTVITALFMGSRYLTLLVLIFIINSFIHSRERNNMNVDSILYLGSVIKAAKRISGSGYEEISCYTSKLKALYGQIQYIAKNSVSFGRAEGNDGLLDSLYIMFLAQERVYLKMSNKINQKSKELLDIYQLIGELDSLIGFSAYRECLEQFSKPNFIEGDAYLNIEKGVHPLIDEPVPNSILLSRKGIILTGTNMSGKSTFLRMVGINVLLAQSFYTCLCDKYEACYMKLMSSISPSDDVTSGKSFYLGEAEAMLRLINNAKDGKPILCLIDEIFRGTNPIERIAASAEILKYIINFNTIVIAATHDHEIARLVGQDYRCYYFSEKVNEAEGLTFDYKIKEGISPTRNAIKLLKFLGYPKDIIEGALSNIGDN